MAFFKRVIDHLLNQVLVESLANSRWFQRFAVWSHKQMQNLNESAKDPNAVLDATLKAAQTQKQGWDKYRQDILDEMRRLREAGPTGTGGGTRGPGGGGGSGGGAGGGGTA